ncbi:class D sortase [Rossellomorea aquimaris]|nr:class D sortase [Rossellomorea aquimaris]WRP07316.1 class D sortase [Rossellomorea aquimaris]
MRNHNMRRSNRLLLLFLSILLIVFGLWFGGTNAYAYLKGYWLSQTDQVDAPDYKAEADVTEQHKEPKPLYSKRPEKGENIGELIIPKLEAKLPIYHGTDENELEKGVGHFADSVLPGEMDNSIMSGHRDTVFRKLGDVGVGDLLIVHTTAGEFTYKVKKVRIVDKDDLTVIVPKPEATLTVSTCYPFHFIGASPERYILVADLITSKEKGSDKSL